MTIMLILAALTMGAFAFTITLYVAGFGTSGSAEATARLGRLASGETSGPSGIPAVVFRLRRPGGVSLGGFNLVNGKISAAWAKQLERAGLTLTPKEYFILRGTVALVLTLVGFVLSPIPLLALILAPVGYLAPGLWLKLRIGGRQRKMESQLIELLQMLSSGLRAGFGLQQALDSSAEQIPAPLQIEVRRALRDIGMGSSVEQALSALNERSGSADFDIVITAILIQRSVGGNLAEILDNVAHTMRERERIRGEIRTLTSQQRLTAFVIGGIPFGLFGAFMVINPEFTGLLFSDNRGRLMLMGALMLEGMGAFVIKKIVSIEV
ncbi:hypothetical protein AYO38_10640 [bacterium SCGC AG-212-C10]|nr:hypothetical protein AYO38_10640 [bacterium SCGC AG-212-C10]